MTYKHIFMSGVDTQTPLAPEALSPTPPEAGLSPPPQVLSRAETLGVLRAAGEATRLRILALLAKGELNVKDLTQILGQSQPRISRHLKLMAEAGLIGRFREGSWVFFRLAEARPQQVVAAE
jgi:hypothetical protein